MSYLYLIWGVKDQLSIKLVLIGYFVFALVNGHIFISSIDYFLQSIDINYSHKYISIFFFIPFTLTFYSFSIGFMIRFLNMIINYFKK